LKTVEPSLFTTLQRYARFSVASLAAFVFGDKTCPSPPFNAPVVSYIENSLTDTQAAIFQDDAAKEFILSFAGSSSLQDFVTDFGFLPIPYTDPNTNCKNCTAHGGVYVAWRSIYNDTVSSLLNLTSYYPHYSVVVTGHSLGGGLAAVAYPGLKATSLPIRAAYTYGSLRVGNPAFANYTDHISGATEENIGLVYRVTHHTDGVPNLPPDSFGFEHSRTEFYQLDNSAGNQTAATTYRCFGQESEDCNKGAAMGFINQDHLMYCGIQMTNGAQCGLSGGLN
jgi:hypothetical protein